MEVTLNPDLENRLAQVAAERGRDAQALAREAIERFLDHDQWFIHEVEKGLAQIDSGEVLTHEKVGARLQKVLAEKRPRE
jgi:predicted transcriptional regulator